MIPIRDSMKSRSFPFVNLVLIVVNFWVFMKELMVEPYQLNQLYYTYGLVPADAVNAFMGGVPVVSIMLPFFTAIFLHGGWVHIIGNMLYLWIFGDNVEDRLGHMCYLFFYLAAGLAGNIVHVAANPSSTVPVIGASGAVAGILGGYFVLFPRSRILALVPIFFFLTLMEVPALIFIAIWFIVQVFNGMASLGGTANAVAWWAHIGGFVAGALLVRLLNRPGPREEIYFGPD